MNRIRIALFSAVLLIIQLKSDAQTFQAAFVGPIPDNNTEVTFPFIVSGLPGQIDMNFGLSQLCLDITHTYVADLRISLRAPDSSEILLANHVGGSGDNFTNTCIAENGTNGWLSQNNAPFNGFYIPEESLNLMNNGMDPNGIWYLCIKDEVPGDFGNLNAAAITFSANPPPDPGLPPGICSTTNASGCLCPDTTQTDCDLLPDMTASALIIQNQHTEHPGYLTLSNATPNIGSGPLEISGTNQCYCDTVLVGCSTPICPDGSYPKQLITQRVYHKNGQTMTHWDNPAGTMTYHPTHGHMHVDNWASYTLRVGTNDPDPLNWPLVGDGAKVSFCLVNLGSCTFNTGYCVDTAGNVLTGNDLPNNGLGIVTGCGNQQGIFVGSLDVYSQGLAGQQIDFPGICNGDYFIISHTDPENFFLETNDNNNYAVVPVTLTQQGTGPANPSFTWQANGLTVDFLSVVPGVTSYKYHFGDGDSSSMAAVTHTFPGPGTYNVLLELNNGVCNAFVAQTVTVNTNVGVSEPVQGIENIVLSPNPFMGSTLLSYELKESTNVTVKLYNMFGEEVDELYTGVQPAGVYKKELHAPGKGVYMLKISTPGYSATQRMISLQ